MAKAEKDAHTKLFNKSGVRDRLIDAWEKMGGHTKVREWPKYKSDVIGSNGKVIRGAEAGKPFQAHHIVPQEVKGPHVWWNMHPAQFPMHQQVLHGSASRLSEILRNLPKRVN